MKKKLCTIGSLLCLLLLFTGCSSNEGYVLSEQQQIAEQLMQQYFLGTNSLANYTLADYNWATTVIEKVEPEVIYVISDDNKSFQAICKCDLYCYGKLAEEDRYFRIGYTLEGKTITVTEVMDYANQTY